MLGSSYDKHEIWCNLHMHVTVVVPTQVLSNGVAGYPASAQCRYESSEALMQMSHGTHCVVLF